MRSHTSWGARHRYVGLTVPGGHTCSVSSFSTRHDAQRAAQREEQKVLAGVWHDCEIFFRTYVETEWLPKQAERGQHPRRL